MLKFLLKQSLHQEELAVGSILEVEHYRLRMGKYIIELKKSNARGKRRRFAGCFLSEGRPTVGNTVLEALKRMSSSKKWEISMRKSLA